jgi:hypothetical protein
MGQRANIDLGGLILAFSFGGWALAAERLEGMSIREDSADKSTRKCANTLFVLTPHGPSSPYYLIIVEPRHLRPRVMAT